MRAARPRLPGWLLEAVGNGGPRGMVIAPRSGNRRGEQDPAYGSLRPSFLFPEDRWSGTAVPACGALPLIFWVEMIQYREQLWQRTLTAVGVELQTLCAQKKSWIAAATARIARNQLLMHELYLAADGPAMCCRCQGACCACGTHHFTLVNLLAYLIHGESPPSPNFSQTCPFLGESGCRLPVARRPFNCVIFLCEDVWEQLSEQQQRQARHLEDVLRRQYQMFDKHFAGSSLHGLLIRAERLDGQALLAPPAGRVAAIG